MNEIRRNSDQPRSFAVSKTAWLRFAEEVFLRWFRQHGQIPSEYVRFGEYLRQRRYSAGLSMNSLAIECEVPYEHIALLERGLLRPSEVPNHIWSRLITLLEGDGSISAPISSSVGRESNDSKISRRTPKVVNQTNRELKNEGPSGLARIRVIGVGGGGTNAVARMSKSNVPGLEFVAINSDAQHLSESNVPIKLQIGEQLTRGLGVGGNPEIGREAAEESRTNLEQLVDGCDMVFIAAGMGGGTGTGAAPVLAGLAKERGVLTIAIVTKPFAFEGSQRSKQAEEGAAQLRDLVDCLIFIPNDRLLLLADREMTADYAFKLADDVLQEGVLSIAELVNVPGEINLDFADVQVVLTGAGTSWIGIGSGRGEGRALEAARQALASPLLELPIEGARRVLYNITGGTDMAMREVRQISDYISSRVDPEANIIFGMVTNPDVDDEVRVTVIASDLKAETPESIETVDLESVLVNSVDPILSGSGTHPVVSWFKQIWTRARGRANGA